jgi:translation elongation factor EF-Tu-like GTPase
MRKIVWMGNSLNDNNMDVIKGNLAGIYQQDLKNEDELDIDVGVLVVSAINGYGVAEFKQLLEMIQAGVPQVIIYLIETENVDKRLVEMMKSDINDWLLNHYLLNRVSIVIDRKEIAKLLDEINDKVYLIELKDELEQFKVDLKDIRNYKIKRKLGKK